MPVKNGKYVRPQLRNSNVNYRYGWFFVTFQVFENKSLLGAIVGAECVLNSLGKTVENLIATLPQYNPEVYVDSFTVMPNHVHLAVKIADVPTNEEHHLGKIMRKLKSLATHEYRLLKEHGLARDIGTKLWQENYWEKIITNHEQLEAIRKYIANNPRRWSLDRFGPVTTYALGNMALLNEPLVAFVASQDGRADVLKPVLYAGHDSPAPRDAGDNAPAAREYASRHTPDDILGERGRRPPPDILGERGRRPPPVISTFTSPQEREVLRRLLAANRRFIAVYPGGIPASLPDAVSEGVETGTALLLSPVESGTGVNKQRAVWCNEYVVGKAAEIWCGAIKPGGTLESILKGMKS